MKENLHHTFCVLCVFAGSECARKSQAAGDPLERWRAATGGENPRPQNQRKDGTDLQWWDMMPVFYKRLFSVLGYIAARLYSLQLPRLPQHPASGAACQQALTLEAETLTRPGRRAPEKKTCNSSWPWPWAKRRQSRYRRAAVTATRRHRWLNWGASVTVCKVLLCPTCHIIPRTTPTVAFSLCNAWPPPERLGRSGGCRHPLCSDTQQRDTTKGQGAECVPGPLCSQSSVCLTITWSPLQHRSIYQPIKSAYPVPGETFVSDCRNHFFFFWWW